MATIQPVFDQIASGSASVGKDLWVDLGLITNGKAIWYGFASFIAEDKSVNFEVRSNTAGYSDGSAAHTTLHDWSCAATGDTSDRDFYQNGAIFVSSVTSTGVEHWWLHLTSISATVGVCDYIIYYTTL